MRPCYRLPFSAPVYLSLAVLFVGISPSLSAQTFPFTSLQPGYSQQLFGTTPPTTGVLGGIAFAPNGDLFVKNCNGTKDLFRFQLAASVTIQGTSVHPQAVGSPISTPFGCGMTKYGPLQLLNGTFTNPVIYMNTLGGVVELNATSGHQDQTYNFNTWPPSTVPIVFGPSGNSLGIATDPQTNRLVYPASTCIGNVSCDLLNVDSPYTTGASRTFATLVSPTAPEAFEAVDGLSFDPTGNFLFVSGRTGVFPHDTPFLSVVNRQGSIQQLDASHFPVGVAFHINPFYAVANNNDGTITRYDFPSEDFSQVPIESVIATGGFRGDLAQVGPDNCLYATQNGTRFADQTTSTGNSVVRICSASGRFFAAPFVQTPSCQLNPSTWQSASNLWPVSNLTLGAQPYTKSELLSLVGQQSNSLAAVDPSALNFVLQQIIMGVVPLNTGNQDWSVVLAEELIAAKLNILNGSDGSSINSAITHSDGLLANFSGKLPYNASLTSLQHNNSDMFVAAVLLHAYNNRSPSTTAWGQTVPPPACQQR